MRTKPDWEKLHSDALKGTSIANDLLHQEPNYENLDLAVLVLRRAARDLVKCIKARGGR